MKHDKTDAPRSKEIGQFAYMGVTVKMREEPDGRITCFNGSDNDKILSSESTMNASSYLAKWKITSAMHRKDCLAVERSRMTQDALT